ncbi:MAG: hypothetical protein EU540_07270 [Promethearchaeota archaeon]|nr:MAG: hypothetical protein EU540_07270 [Candidatus Lokiarchaeota archaeon]
MKKQNRLNMSEAYGNFMVFELDDSGERIRLSITEEEFCEENGSKVLHPEQVAVIVKEAIRRIYIWKGAKSPVRRRFISSRVASQLQQELINNAAFHRCKIVSVDQGDEVEEFLKAFRLTSMPVEEKLADMRYIRNIDREKMIDAGVFPKDRPKYVKVEKEVEKITIPATKEIQKPMTKTVATPSESIVSKSKSRENSLPPRRTSKLSKELSEELTNQIKDKILKNEVPEGYIRQNLIFGHILYGAVNKRVDVLGKKIQETVWENVKKVPEGMIELDNQKVRVYFNAKKGIVEAVELFEEEEKKPIPKKKSTAKRKPAPRRKPTAKRRPPAKKKPATKKS